MWIGFVLMRSDKNLLQENQFGGCVLERNKEKWGGGKPENRRTDKCLDSYYGEILHQNSAKHTKSVNHHHHRLSQRACDRG
ncbi:hypothetical protein DP175_05580 [Polynucleobacter paneuropaeus]|nr:hypothetical protein DP175_05580 [Polynucleobacter paneuropaeus]